MEELLVVIFQLIFEVGLQVLAELPWDLFVGSHPTVPSRGSHSGLWIVLSLVVGGAVGGLSLLVFPTTLIRWGGARMANLIVAPTVSGLVSLLFSRLRAGQSENPFDPKLRAWCAACFTLALALIRFTYASRPIN